MKMIGTLAAIAGLGLAVLPSAAQSAPDTTDPTLRTPVKSSFLVGRSVSYDVPDEPGCPPSGVNVREAFSWRGSDNNSPVLYTVVENTVGEGDTEVLTDSTHTRWSPWGTNWNHDCGGGAWQPKGWTVTAKDPAGNTTTKFVAGGLIAVTQNDGSVNNVWRKVAPSLVYSGAWTRSSHKYWSRGTSRMTSARNASVTATVTVAAGDATHLGLVMAKGPGRGEFKVYVDDVLKATVDNYAAAFHPRKVTWQGALPSGTHRVKVVNVGTAGRPRIDLDAVLTN